MIGETIESSQAFYEWEELRYSGTSPLSDDDRHIWTQGYVYASELMKHKNSFADMRTPDELYNFLDNNGIDYEVVEIFEGIRTLSIEVNDELEEEEEREWVGTIRMREDLIEEGLSVPASFTFENYDTMIHPVFVTAEELEGATQGDDPRKSDEHAFCYVKLKDGRCMYFLSVDLDFK